MCGKHSYRIGEQLKNKRDSMSSEQSLQQTQWQRAKKPMVVTLSIWFVFSFVVHWFADSLNAMSFLGFPFGFYMAARAQRLSSSS